MTDLRSDTKLKEFFDYIAFCDKNWENLSFDEIRKRDTTYILSKVKPVPAVEHTEEVQIPGSDNNSIALRIYTPKSTSKSLPVGVYFHGGGWVLGSVEQSDNVARLLANGLESIIVSVEYRLAPEFPFPKGLEDCYSATCWVAKHFHGRDIFSIGESAGGNLAAAVALIARDRSGPKLCRQVLLYPVITSHLDDTTYARSPDQYFITKETMKYFWNMYCEKPGDTKNPYASIDLADHQNLPPTLIVTAEYDPLKPEAENYAKALRHADVPVNELCLQKAVHGCLFIPPYDMDQKRAWVHEIFNMLSSDSACRSFPQD